MNSNTLVELTNVFRKVFDDNELTLTPQTTSNDVPGWDSFSHINLMVTVENHFGIKFKDKEMNTFKNVGELLDSITTKCEQN
jgi:acyl carrier protein